MSLLDCTGVLMIDYYQNRDIKFKVHLHVHLQVLVPPHIITDGKNQSWEASYGKNQSGEASYGKNQSWEASYGKNRIITDRLVGDLVLLDQVAVPPSLISI
jgi:hypothetical protein